MIKMSEVHNLQLIATLIKKYAYKAVVLQFTDDDLPCCVPVFEELTSLLNDNSINLFIAADSTYGSSVDDISALHVNSDCLVYFGADLSSSGVIPVMVSPKLKSINVQDCVNMVYSSIESDGSISTVLVLYEPGYDHAVGSIMTGFRALSGDKTVNWQVASLPSCAVSSDWVPPTPTLASESNNSNSNNSSNSSNSNSNDGAREVVGGLAVENFSMILQTSESTRVVYIGNKQEQISAIGLRLCDHTITQYNPEQDQHHSITQCKGNQMKEFKQRSGCMLKVEHAKLIGIIIGSMGLTEADTRGIVDRLQALIEASGRRHYTFVMGRLNESKLANFPEVDLFCLISNADTALIDPKTFHVPVITPWELELGLGAREWTSTFHADPASILADEVTLDLALQRVNALRLVDAESDADSDEEDSSNENDGNGSKVVNNLRGSKYININGTNNPASATPPSATVDGAVVPFYNKANILNDDGNTNSGSGSNVNQQLTVFQSPSGEFLKAREYQGLNPALPENCSDEIQQGQFGIAAGYSYDGNNANHSISNNNNT